MVRDGQPAPVREAVLERVGEHARQIAAHLDGATDVPVRIVWRPVVTTPEEIAGVLREADAAPDCVGVVAWMHTFSPAKMWIAGLTDLRKPLVHLHTQYNRDLPWAEIDMEFMNLHQSAHGDREFAFIQTRLRRARKTVVGHWQDPVVARRLGAWSRAAAGWHEAHRLRIARFGDNMREVAVTEGDKVEAQARLGFSVNGYGVSDLVRRVESVSDADVDSLVAIYEASYDVVPDLRRAGSRHAELRTAARIEAGLRCFLEEGGFGGFTDTFEDLSDLKQLPGIGVQRLMADGYGFGAEGDWKAAAWCASSRSWRPGSRAGRPSWRTTPTISAIRSRRSLARTCSRSVRRSPPGDRRARSIPCRSADGGPPSASAQYAARRRVGRGGPHGGTHGQRPRRQGLERARPPQVAVDPRRRPLVIHARHG